MNQQIPATQRMRFPRWLPGLLISAVAIYAVIKFSSLQDIKEAFKQVDFQFILVIFLLTVFSLFVRAVAWKTILGKRVSLKTAFFGVSEGYFLNNLFPFRAGEIGRSVFVGRSSGLGVFHVLSTILIERAFDILFAAGILLVTIPFIIGSDWMKPIAYTAFLVVVLGMVGLFLIANHRQRFQAWLEKHEFRSKFINNRILPQITKLIDGLSALSNPAQFLLSFFWIALSWITWTFVYYAAVAQLAPGGPVWWGSFVSSVLALGVAVPSAPAAVGVFEAAMVGALAVLGISSSAALAYAIILHVNQIIISAIFGIWGLAREGQNLSSLLSSITDRNKVKTIGEKL